MSLDAHEHSLVNSVFDIFAPRNDPETARERIKRTRFANSLAHCIDAHLDEMAVTRFTSFLTLMHQETFTVESANLAADVLEAALLHIKPTKNGMVHDIYVLLGSY